jgi:hypothetical protein
MNSSQFSNEDYDIMLFKVFNKLKNAEHSKLSHKELKKVKQEKESLIVQLSESHALIDSLRSENTMLFNLIDTLENRLKESEHLLKKFSSDNLKSMLCIHSDVSNKLDLTVDDVSASTSHASDSELDIMPMIEDIACLDNSCLTNHVMLESKESGRRGKVVPTCCNCGKIGHIRPNFYLLKSHRPWFKQDAMRKSEVDDSSSSKYVHLHRRHMEGKSSAICKNANDNFAENTKKHSNKEACLPVITAASPVTSDPNVLSSRRCRFRGSCQQELHLRWVSRLYGISRILFLLNRVANQGATRESRRSPIVAMAMKDC